MKILKVHMYNHTFLSFPKWREREGEKGGPTQKTSPGDLSAGEILEYSRQQQFGEPVYQVSVKVRLSGSVEVTRAIQSGTGISGITTPFGGTFRDFHKRGRAGVCH